jgi:hypothetical protein
MCLPSKKKYNQATGQVLAWSLIRFGWQELKKKRDKRIVEFRPQPELEELK